MKQLLAILLLCLAGGASGALSTPYINANAYGFLPAATAAANAAALNKVITTYCVNGCEIAIPPGSYNVAADTVTFPTPNITIKGAGSASGYGAPNAGTNITFGAGTVGFDLTAITGTGSAGNYTLLQDMNISCNNVCTYPIKAEGLVYLDHLNVTGSTSAGAGIWMYDLVNGSRISNVSAVGNNGYGLVVGGLGAGTGSNTDLYIDHFTARSNLVGARFEQASHTSVRDSVFESNTHEGIQLFVLTGQAMNNLEFDNVWLENNWTGGGGTNYNLTISNYNTTDTSGPVYVTFKNSMFNATGSTGAINVISGLWISFRNCQAVGGITIASTASAVSFYNQNGGTITDNGNRTWQGNDERSLVGGGHIGGPYYSSLSAGQFALQSAGLVTTGLVSGAATTVYTMVSSGQMRYYMVFAKILGGTASATNYSAYALVAADSTSKLMQHIDGADLVLSVSGLNIQATQSSGGPLAVEVQVIPVFQVF